MTDQKAAHHRASAHRLANFNIMESETGTFQGGDIGEVWLSAALPMYF